MMATAFTITMILMQLAIAFCYDMNHAPARGSPDGLFSGNTDPPTGVMYINPTEGPNDI